MSDLFKQYAELTFEPTPEKVTEGHSIVLEVGFHILNEFHKKIEGKPRTSQEQDALMTYQMVMAKGIAIATLAKGVSFQSKTLNSNISNLLDPTSIAALVRTQFEAFANFYNIYNSSNDENLRDLLYSVWVLAGLKERQRTIDPDISTEQRQKVSREKERIEKISEEIVRNSIYLGLETENQRWFEQQIKKRNFEFIYKDGKITKPGWRELFLNTGASDAFYSMYSLMSLSTHPSNVSVFQFAQMFQMKFNVQMLSSFQDYSKIIMAFMIASYCQYFPQAKLIFDELPRLNRVLIDSINANYRGVNYSISDSHSKFMEEHNSDFSEFLFGSSN